MRLYRKLLVSLCVYQLLVQLLAGSGARAYAAGLQEGDLFDVMGSFRHLESDQMLLWVKHLTPLRDKHGQPIVNRKSKIQYQAGEFDGFLWGNREDGFQLLHAESWHRIAARPGFKQVGFKVHVPTASNPGRSAEFHIEYQGTITGRAEDIRQASLQVRCEGQEACFYGGNADLKELRQYIIEKRESLLFGLPDNRRIQYILSIPDRPDRFLVIDTNDRPGAPDYIVMKSSLQQVAAGAVGAGASSNFPDESEELESTIEFLNLKSAPRDSSSSIMFHFADGDVELVLGKNGKASRLARRVGKQLIQHDVKVEYDRRSGDSQKLGALLQHIGIAPNRYLPVLSASPCDVLRQSVD